MSTPERSVVSRMLDADHEWRKKLPPTDDRFRRTLALLPDHDGSLLDAGAGEGDWLELLSKRRPGLRLAALDLSAKGLENLSVVHADGSRPATLFGDVTAMPTPDASFDVVSLLEIIEHVPDWHGAVREALRVARRRVLITVPYRELLMDTVCVHCHHVTPLWGHLHSFDEHSFDAFADRARITTSTIRTPIPRESGMLRWLFRQVIPVKGWLAVRLDKV